MTSDPFDPKLGAMLRDHSTEMPSRDLDAAILAAAHRAVQSAPRAAEATSPWRWWMPLAAAATIGAIAIGVLQLLPKEPESTATVVSDMPSAARVAPQRVEPQTIAPAPAVESAKPAVPPPPAAPVTNERREGPSAQSEKPRAKVRIDTPSPRMPANDDAKRAASPEPFPAQERDTAASSNAAGALARSESAAPRAAAPAVAKQSAAADTQVMSAERWIARIRTLLEGGKPDEAARELVAFRAAYGDADARLPDDLKAWAATIKR